MKSILILGGAGFIGSNLVKKFVDSDYHITVIDGFIDCSGTSINNLNGFEDKIKLIKNKVEGVKNLSQLLNNTDLIIDCMGWTSHREAIKDPITDIQMNLISHLTVINALKHLKGKALIYIGTRAQYGNISEPLIGENDCMNPEDVQGIDKLAAEHYYRIYSKFYNFNVISLRIPNTFGEGQNVKNSDIGLIGSFIKESIEDKTIKIYGQDRKRSIIYVKDFVNIVFELRNKIGWGFNAYNLNGTSIAISKLAESIIKITGTGKLLIEPIPEEIGKMDMGSSSLDEKKIKRLLSVIKYTDMKTALVNTVQYFKNEL